MLSSAKVDPLPAPTPTPSPAPSPSPSPVASPENDWWNTVPPEIQKSLEPLKGKPVSEVAKAYAHAQSLIGNSIRVPEENAPPEEWNRYYSKLGRPESPEGYSFTPPALPEGEEVTPDAIEALQKFAHENGLTQKQFQALANQVGNGIMEEHREYSETMKKAEETLRTEWKGDTFDRNLAIAVRAVHHLDPSGEMMKALEETGAENDPRVIKALYSIGKKFIEDGLVAGDVSGVTTKTGAQAKINAIYADRSHPYHNRLSPRHQDALDEMLMLQKVLTGE